MKSVIAKEYLCFDALLEMIISHACPSSRFTQTDLAEIFGVTIPKGTQAAINNVRFSNDIKDFGTNICISDINDFFHDNSVPLQISYISSNYIDELSFVDIIEGDSRSYIIFAFCYGLLYNEPKNNEVGHVVLLEKIDTKTDTIQIYDPGPRNHGSKTVKVDDMVYAMKRRGGIYLFEKVDH